MKDQPPPPADRGTPSLSPLGDDAAKAQLVDLGRQIVTAAGLRDVDAGFRFTSCNDQGDPPHRGALDIGFGIPAGHPPSDYLAQVAARMRSAGWVDGPPPGQTYPGLVLRRAGVTAQFRPPTGYDPKGVVHLYGECRNMSDHRGDGPAAGHDVTAEIR